MKAHTNGPWHVGMKPGPIVYGPKGEQIADLRADLLPKDENAANARLIACAPALLEALQQLRKQVHEYRLLDIRKRFSLCTADAQAGTAIHRAIG